MVEPLILGLAEIFVPLHYLLVKFVYHLAPINYSHIIILLQFSR